MNEANGLRAENARLEKALADIVAESAERLRALSEARAEIARLTAPSGASAIERVRRLIEHDNCPIDDVTFDHIVRAIEQAEHEARAATLEETAKNYRYIIGQAGIPDSVEACRQIIATCERNAAFIRVQQEFMRDWSQKAIWSVRTELDFRHALSRGFEKVAKDERERIRQMLESPETFRTIADVANHAQQASPHWLAAVLRAVAALIAEPK